MSSAAAPSRASAGTALDAEVIIVGAGFGGLGMAMRLQAAGHTSFIVLERAGRLGGTWRDNVYPGCACDIPSMLYSFSFAPHLAGTRIYPGQAELLGYLERTAREQRITDRIRFHSELAEARYDEAAGTWAVRLTDGSVLHSRVLVSAMGPLNKPKFPDLAGRDSFAGPSFHSSNWDDAVDLTGKRVVVVGTGASAIQFVPRIAPQVARLTVFQRTPPWITPRNDKPVGRLHRALRARLPLYAWLVRKTIYWTLELRALGFVVDPKLLQRAEKLLERYLAQAVPDPVLRAKLTPAYRAGCKRILISDDYYPALQRDNVELVTDAIAEVRPHSVVTGAGREIAADVVIYATGFKATEGIVPVRVYGRGGAELGAAWRDGISAYLGTTVAGFPNLFLVIGPNTGLGHNSMVFMMEAQYRYIVSALEQLERSGARALEVKPEVMQAFNDDLQAKMQGTVWASGCSSWYQDAGGKNVSLWPGFTFAYRNRTRRFDRTAYTLR